MKIKRELLKRHLRRIRAGDQIKEAVFTGAFATTALTPDAQLLVLAPPLVSTEELPEDIGFADLDKFTKALGVLSGEGPESADVEIKIEDHRLILDEGYRGTMRLLTAAPKTVGTRIEPETVEKLLKKAPELPKKNKKGEVKGPGVIPITQALTSGVSETFALFKASEVELFVGPKGGRIRVGNENSDIVEFESAELQAPEEYSLLFGGHLIDILKIITDYAQAFLILGGKDNFISIQDGEFRYILAPKAKGADA